MTYIVMDNRVYGMTKGQPSPTTEPDWDSKLSPDGTGLREFHPMVVALSSGANFIARAFTGDPNGLADLIVQAVRHPGFSFVEVLSPCVTFRPEQRDWKKDREAGRNQADVGHRTVRRAGCCVTPASTSASCMPATASPIPRVASGRIVMRACSKRGSRYEEEAAAHGR